ncbi:MAG: hypothetical protein PWP67_1890 [Clostridium butyricum]|nr:hypothetical protein [Clostridium butyricum]
MKKEIKDKNKLLGVRKVLSDFLDNDDCGRNCKQCDDKNLCDEMYRLDTTVNMRYLKRMPPFRVRCIDDDCCGDLVEDRIYTVIKEINDRRYVLAELPDDEYCTEYFERI